MDKNFTGKSRWRNFSLGEIQAIWYLCMLWYLPCIECEDVDAIDMKLNEVYGISTTANDIKTIPNEVYIWTRCKW